MSNLLNAPFLQKMMDTCANMYRLGWDERNGGNISLLLNEEELAPYLENELLRTISLGFDATELK